jgi:hypothetical protein
MDMLGEDYMKVLSLASPPLEKLAGPQVAMELSIVGSDSMAELYLKYPDRFPEFIGTAPMNYPENCVAECRRAIEKLGAVGMQIFTNVANKPLDMLPMHPLILKEGQCIFEKPSASSRKWISATPSLVCCFRIMPSTFWVWIYEPYFELERLKRL